MNPDSRHRTEPRSSGMHPLPLRLVSGCLLALAVAAQDPKSPATHDAAFWRRCLAREAVPPTAAEVPALLVELTAMLASPDPEVRDDLAFSVLAKWLGRNGCVPVEQRRILLANWQAGLCVGIGDTSADSVFRRSFSALCLSLLVAHHNQDAWLTRSEFDALFDAILAYLRDERDVRGFVLPQGWCHSVAHTADVLKFLLRSEHLGPAQQKAALAAIAAKLATTTEPLVHGEDDRLARAVLSLLARPDCDAEAVAAFLPEAWPRPGREAPTLAALAQQHNRRNLVLSLSALLQADPRQSPSLATARAAVAAFVPTRLR